MTKIPDALERRDLLYGRPKRAPDYADLGERYLAAGRRADALEAFTRLEDAEDRRARIANLRDEAVGDGTVFLLERIAVVGSVEEGHWKAASQAAEQGGKLRYALTAARRAGDAARVADLEERLGLSKPALPEGEGDADEGGESDSEG